MSKKFNVFTFVVLACLSLPSFAALMYATGEDLNNDGIDDQFSVNGNNAYLVTHAAAGWPALPNVGITTGKYISWAANQSNAARGGGNLGHVYDYGFDFNWGGAALSTTFDFRWISDDYLLDVFLNGVSLGVTNQGMPQPWTISNSASGVNGTVVSGLNSLLFRVQNTFGGPTGLAADFTVHGDATKVSEPAPLVLLGLALMALGMRRVVAKK